MYYFETKEFKFIVIGGQYNTVCYGGANTLRGAQIIASKNKEYWDNWQGWHYPLIYIKDSIEEASKNIWHPDGVVIKEYAEAIASRGIDDKQWTIKDKIFDGEKTVKRFW